MKKFLAYMFLRRLPTLAAPDCSDTVEAVDDLPSKPNLPGKLKLDRAVSQDDEVRNRIIVHINRLVGFICIASFVFILGHAAISSGGEVPDTIKNTFSMTLGYFVSALITFVERRPKKA